MDPSCGVKKKYRRAADIGREPQGDPAAYFWYKATEDIRNG